MSKKLEESIPVMGGKFGRDLTPSLQSICLSNDNFTVDLMIRKKYTCP